MAIRFTKRFKILPGVSVNLGKKGASVSVGPRGAKMTFGSSGARVTTGIPGTGLYSVSKIGSKKDGVRYKDSMLNPPVKKSSALTLILGTLFIMSFIAGVFSPGYEGSSVILLMLGVFFIIYGATRKRSYEKKLVQHNQAVAHFKFNTEAPQLIDVINSSRDIINKTKNVETAIGRFNTIKGNMATLFEILPPGQDLSIQLNDGTITSENYDSLVEKEKERWIREHFKDRINIEMEKADSLNAGARKKNQYKKALDIALKALEYLPSDNSLRERISNIEKMIDES